MVNLYDGGAYSVKYCILGAKFDLSSLMVWSTHLHKFLPLLRGDSHIFNWNASIRNLIVWEKIILFVKKKTYIVNPYPLIDFLIFNFLCFVYTTDFQGGVTIQAAPSLLVNVKKMRCKYQTLVWFTRGILRSFRGLWWKIFPRTLITVSITFHQEPMIRSVQFPC